ncbi:MAG: ATP-binding cassette domain-containing protein [Betaproteobacteria bacterium]|nr:ATP-binding cassette domain-containing protein [Betaproteobacteria bacterium]
MIKVDHVTKTFGPKRAVDDLSFAVERGEVLGFLGPNGAGKSTTMRMITGFIPVDAGGVSVCGFDIAAQPIDARRRIGYLPESAPTYTDMSVNSFLGWAAEMRGLSGDAKKKAVHRAIELCSLGSVVYQSIDTLSKGFRHRTCLAQAILHDPEVLIMDEPTDGLDPNQKHEIRSLIRRMSPNKAIIFSTHILEEVEAVCTRAIIIDRGRMVANGTPSELKAKSDRAGAVLVMVRGAASQAVTDTLGRVPGVARAELVATEQDCTTVRAYPQQGSMNGALAAVITKGLSATGWAIDGLQTEEGRLDDVFRLLTRPDTPATVAKS